MDGSTTVRYLQEYLRQKDYSLTALASADPAHREAQAAWGREHCFLKLVEEVGEVARTIKEGKTRQAGEPVKGTLDEELWDVMYYVLCLADHYGIDMEEAIREKEELNNRRYHDERPFEVGR